MSKVTVPTGRTSLTRYLLDDNLVNALAGGGEVIGGPYRLLLLVIAEELELVGLDCFNRHNLVQQLHPLCDFTKGRIVPVHLSIHVRHANDKLAARVVGFSEAPH